MTCQNLQNKLLNITVLFVWYSVFVGEFKKNVTHQAWRALFQFGEYLFQSTRHFGECLKKMVFHIVGGVFLCFLFKHVTIICHARFQEFNMAAHSK
jgi:hypothetical protein